MCRSGKGKAPRLFGSTWCEREAESAGCWSTGAPWHPSGMLAYSYTQYRSTWCWSIARSILQMQVPFDSRGLAVSTSRTWTGHLCFPGTPQRTEPLPYMQALLLLSIAIVYGSADVNLMQSVGQLCRSTWFTARYTLHMQVPFDRRGSWLSMQVVLKSPCCG